MLNIEWLFKGRDGWKEKVSIQRAYDLSFYMQDVLTLFDYFLF